MILISKYQLSFVILLTGILHLIMPAKSFAQQERSEVRSGNRLYEKGKYNEAETEYRKALDKNKSSFPGSYNLSGSLYRQKKYEDAIQQYQQTIEKNGSDEEKADTYHNLGNSLLQAGKYEESIQAYKNSLKLKPEDNDTRYNLAYAQAMLRKQQQQQQQNKDNNQQNKDNKNQQNKQDQNKQQQKQDQNKQDQNKQDQKDQKDQKKEAHNKDQKPKISKEDAERLLQALKNEEQNLQQKLAKKEGERIKVEKDW